uniref:Putative opsin-like receptor n=1 Tax=Schistosoma mansoni TaxID=6183 RepID=A0A3Q0KTR1_SCHMA
MSEIKNFTRSLLLYNRTFSMIKNNIHDSDIIMLNHWIKYTQPDPIYNYLVAIFVALIGIFGTITNLLVIFVFLTPKSSISLQCALIINLAISDFGFSAVIGFPLKTIAAFNQYWPWGSVACQLYGFISATFGFLSLTTIAAISFDRYLVIVKDHKTTNFRVICTVIGFLWIWSIIWTIPPFFGFGRYVLEGYQTSCTFDYISNDMPSLLFSGGMYIFGFMFPVLLCIYCYVNLLKIVRNNERVVLISLSNDGASKQRESVRNRKRLDIEATKSVILSLLFYLMSWTPYAMVCLISILGQSYFLTPTIAEMPHIFAKMAAIYNPILYAFTNRKFKNALGIRKTSSVIMQQQRLLSKGQLKPLSS